MAKRKPTEALHPAVAIARGRRILAERAAAADDPKPETDRMIVPEGEAPEKPHRHPNSPWKPTIVARLTKLWTEDGATAIEIAADLSRKLRYRVTPSAVRSKIGNLGLTGKGACDGRGGRPAGRMEASAGAVQPKRGGIWTDEAVERLTKLWTEEGASLSQIASVLGVMAGQPVSRNAIIGKIERLGLIGKGKRAYRKAVEAASATGSEKRADLTTGQPAQDRKLTQNACPNPTIEPAKINTPPEPDFSALFGVRLTERPVHPAGQWPLADMRTGQCRFACNDVPRGGQHLFCGEPADPEDRHGSWCVAHRAVVFSTESRLADRRFLKAAGKCR